MMIMIMMIMMIMITLYLIPVWCELLLLWPEIVPWPCSGWNIVSPLLGPNIVSWSVSIVWSFYNVLRYLEQVLWGRIFSEGNALYWQLAKPEHTTHWHSCKFLILTWITTWLWRHSVSVKLSRKLSILTLTQHWKVLTFLMIQQNVESRTKVGSNQCPLLNINLIHLILKC